MSKKLPETGTKEWSDLVQSELEDGAYECSPACNCMYCRLSQDSSIAFSGSAIPVKPDTTEYASVPRVERFSDLPDGAIFYLAQTYAYGGRQALIKTLEDGGEHNAVYAVYGGIGIHINDDRLVIRK